MPASVLYATVVIQKWVRRWLARHRLRYLCSWQIFQSLEYDEEGKDTIVGIRYICFNIFGKIIIIIMTWSSHLITISRIQNNYLKLILIFIDRFSSTTSMQTWSNFTKKGIPWGRNLRVQKVSLILWIISNCDTWVASFIILDLNPSSRDR